MGVIEPIELTLDKPRRLLLDNRAIALAEREMARFWGQPKASFFKVWQDAERGELAYADLVCLLCAGLQHEDQALTLDGTFALLQGLDLGAITTALMQAVQRQVLGEAQAPPPSAGREAGAPGPLEHPPSPAGSATPTASGSGSGPTPDPSSGSPTPSSGS